MKKRFFISLRQVTPKKSFLEEIITIYKLVGQRENCKDIYIPFLCTLVKAHISRISTHLLKSFQLSTILKKREEKKKQKNKGKGM